MKDESSEQRELTDQVHQLAQAALRGELTHEAAKQLETMVTADVRARAIYASFIFDTVILRTIASQQEDCVSEKSKREAIELLALACEKRPLPVENASGSQCFIELPQMPSTLGRASSLLNRISPLRLVNGYTLAVLVISVCAATFSAGVMFGLLRDRAPGELIERHLALSAPRELAPNVVPAAYLMSANGCNWGRSGPAIWNVGQSVQAGDEVALNEGVAEFRLAGGAYLGAEGPASLLLASPSTLVLQYGKLTSHVPWGSSELKIVAAGCRILAREAEFGLSYSNNKLHIHVFSGQVTADSLVAPANLKDTAIVDGDWATVDGENCFTDAVITAGRVLQLTVQGEVLKVAGWDKAKPSDFIGKLSMSGPLNVTQGYVEQVLASKPIGYWRFEQIVNSRVPNEISSGSALKVRHEPSLDGSRENFSADFYPNGKFYLLSEKELPLANTDYSIEVWVKPSHLHIGSIATLINIDKETNRHSGVRLELQGARSESFKRQHPGVIRFHHYRDYHRDANDKPTNEGTSCFSSGEYAMRRWQHFVAVKCGSDMNLYVNGRVAGSAKDATMLPNDVRLHVGVESDYRSRRFIGQIDELAIYNRALSKQEVSKHYKSLKQAISTPGSARSQTPVTAKPTDT